VITPAWLLRAALSGARASGAPFDVGDPLLGFVYQPAVRAFRVRLYGDDLSFLQAGLPALFVSDSSFTRFYPHYHLPSDTAERLDAAALQRMGTGVLGIVEALQRVPLSREPAPSWYAALGQVLEGSSLVLLALLAVAPGVYVGARAKGPYFGIRLTQAALFGVLLVRHPVPALFCLALPTLVTPFVRGRWSLLALLPTLALLTLGVAGALRAAGPGGAIVTGLWLRPWEVVLLGLALAAAWLGRPPGAGPVWKKAAGPRTRGRR
jgi:hypothetical protein